MMGRCVAPVMILLFCFLSVHKAQSELLSFLEDGFLLAQADSLPPVKTGSDGKQYRPLIQGYPLGDWDDGRTVIQVLQADVKKGSPLEQDVDTFIGDDGTNVTAVEVVRR
ncbi:uncharacterized protein LOC135215207 [Macrobrachium nipponense]|uniref:uncharacterized protein LOC135215207 n=1 Tax=Macrobrachium nipponense TaxID=159736 RepID=UPI0030C8BF65